MPHENDSAVLDSARLHTRRLMQALQYGHQPVPVRRSLPLLVASLVAAAGLSAACVGYSFMAADLDPPPQHPGTAETAAAEAPEAEAPDAPAQPAAEAPPTAAASALPTAPGTASGAPTPRASTSPAPAAAPKEKR
ncbi:MULTISPECIES: hypothetical protein [unclassified Actinomyces]|uniref:hypothetical protein n=1 Tax=unclassified Actinomyces TaxID=2609248 RepID=UPI0013E9C0FF|nr:MULTISPECIES: hypothetical protein [unclassified Actinomyces]QQO78904.1 hypothetical protein JJJ15_06555 [Actinomyces sp. HMT897]